ncbi:MAG TPA: hypothetical protein VLD39_13420, partial [Gammaproteobacteria bacterium]|nr:hypothetical protein [Gammaproteobacteria bacterium]
MKCCGSRFLLLLLPALVPMAGAQPASDSSDGIGRDGFRVAFELARAGQTPSAADTLELQRHPLYEYLLAERIIAGLGSAVEARTPADERAAEFITTHEGDPVVWQLRYAWLTSLARRRQWEALLTEYR